MKNGNACQMRRISWLKRALGRPRTLAFGMLVFASYAFLQSPQLLFVGIGPADIECDTQAAERVLVIAPHPDDDILGVGSSIVAFREQGIPVLVVFLTSGDANLAGKRLITLNPFSLPSEFRALGSRRQKEAVVALGRLGVAPESIVFLNYPDRGLQMLLDDHWHAIDPFRSPYTNRSTKYLRAAFNAGSPYCGEGLLRDLQEIIWAFRPTILYLPHPLDAHEDHRAGYSFARMAIDGIDVVSGEFSPPAQRCYLVHSYAGLWPTPSRITHLLPLHPMDDFLERGTWHAVELAAHAIEAKYRALRAHASQWWTSGFFMRRFVCSNELYMVEEV
jgi:LmbE family N-acetylglucosaminyl deacetylase